MKNIKRKDNPKKASIENSDELLKRAPNKKGRYVKVKTVLK
jgi:Asp-tRNA(Asn)/Glu-tRNA(Gln) amidotransferase C subunit